MKTATKVFAGIFGVLAVVFYVLSIQEVDTGFGSIQVANMQATVFAAACAVMCCVNVVGVLLMNYIDQINANVNNEIAKKSVVPVSDVNAANTPATSTTDDEWTTPSALQSAKLLEILNTSADAETLRKRLYIMTTSGSLTREEDDIVLELMNLPTNEICNALREKLGA